MRITEVSTIKLRYVMDTPMADAIHFMPERTLLLVQVQTDTGLTGIGEAATYGGHLDTLASIVENELRPSLLGEDPFMVERLWSRMAWRGHQRGQRGVLPMAISGVDIALWDLIGQATATPLYRLFGASRDQLTAYASAGFYAANKSVDDLAAEFAGYAALGFRHGKLKVGRNPDVLSNPLHHMWASDYALATLDEDVARVRAVRAAVGPDFKLAIDANNAWTAPVAQQFMARVADQDIAWLEEPVATDDLAGSAELAARLATPVSGYESETGLGGFRDLIEHRAVDIVQPDVIWSGGFTECRKIAALAHAHRLPVIPHVFSSAIALIANMHLIASIPNGGLLEWDRNPNPLRTDLLLDPLEIARDGTVRLPERPGLGARLNPETIDRYRVV